MAPRYARYRALRTWPRNRERGRWNATDLARDIQGLVLAAEIAEGCRAVFLLVGQIGRPKKRAEWARLLDAQDIPNGPINTLDQVVADAQTQALGMVQTKPGSDLGLVGLPLSFDGIRPAFDKAGPALGDDNSKLDR